MNTDDIKGILNIGGTILGTTNRGNPFSFPVKEGKKWVEKVIPGAKKVGLDAIIVTNV